MALTHSIRQRLQLGLTAAIATLWIVVIAATYFGAQREVGELLDTQLEQAARVATRTMFGLPQVEEPAPPGERDYRKILAVQIWDNSGELIVNSRNAPNLALDPDTNGFKNTLIDGQRWRTFTFRDETNGLIVRAAEPFSPRDVVSRQVLTQTLYPVIVGLPLVAIIIGFMVRRGFRPMKRLAREIHQRDSDNMDQIDAPFAPSEVKPLVDELNVLLARLKQKIDNERHFVGDAAHELRTPLAGLKAQAEVAMGARSTEERNAALSNILSGVERASHLVNQLLTLSRFDETEKLETQKVAIKPVIHQVLVDLLPFADKHGVELALDIENDNSAAVNTNADALYVLIRNIIENAVKYSPQNTEVEVSAAQRQQFIEISVVDRGPGIPDADKIRVFDRFLRRGNRQSYGSGLGLSIAARIAKLLNGSIELTDGPHNRGLRVRIKLPIAAQVDDDQRSHTQLVKLAGDQAAG